LFMERNASASVVVCLLRPAVWPEQENGIMSEKPCDYSLQADAAVPAESPRALEAGFCTALLALGMGRFARESGPGL
jgi:hypothetical protein